MSPDSLSVIVRTAGYLGLLQAAGAVLFLLQFRAHLDASRDGVRVLGVKAALLTMPCIIAHLLLDAARMAGEYQGMTDPELLRLALQSGSGAAHALQLAGLALIAVGLRRDNGWPASGAGAALAILAFISFTVTPFSCITFGVVMGLVWLSVVPPTNGIIAVMFGTKWLATLAGFAFLSHQVGGFLGAWLGGILFDRFGSYDPVWWLSIALGVASALINLPIIEKPISRPAMATA